MRPVGSDLGYYVENHAYVDILCEEGDPLYGECPEDFVATVFHGTCIHFDN